MSKFCLNLKDINKIININDANIRRRICYGFLDKKSPNEVLEIYQNRWFFLISSKPLTKIGNILDDKILDENIFLDQNKNESNIAFDTLYYFEVKNNKDRSKAKGFINIA